MDEAIFQTRIKEFAEYRTSTPAFIREDFELMTPTQLSKVLFEMIKWTGPGSYSYGSELFELINYLDETLRIKRG